MLKNVVKLLKTHQSVNYTRSGINNLRKNRTNKPRLKSQRTEKLRSELIWDEHGHMTKIVCIIAPIECYSDIFNHEESFRMIDALFQFIVILHFMIVIATGFLPLSAMSGVSTMVMWESSQCLGKNIVRSTGQKNSRKAWICALAP